MTDLLWQLQSQGAVAVPGADLGWSLDQMGAIERGLTMRYLRRDETDSGTVFSLTPAGFRTIGEPVPFSYYIFKLRLMLR